MTCSGVVKFKTRGGAEISAIVYVVFSPAEKAELTERGVIRGVGVSVDVGSLHLPGAVAVARIEGEGYCWTRAERPDWFAVADRMVVNAAVARFEAAHSCLAEMVENGSSELCLEGSC